MTTDTAAPAPEAKPPVNSSLKERAKGALMFAPPVLVVIWLGGALFAWMMAAAAAIGAFEWTRMVTTGQEKPPAYLNYLTAAFAALSVLVGAMVKSPIMGLWFLLALSAVVMAYSYAQSGPKPKLVVFGLIYVGFAVAMMIWLRDSSAGLFHFCTLLFIVWASDICAYFTGRTLGGPKLAPKISPKKTWSGFLGSSVGAGLVAAGMASEPFLKYFGIEGATLGGMGPLGYFVLGFVLAMFGQAGDLFISLFKRHFGVKDTGALIPGHGGILDRIDALLLVSIIFGAIKSVAG
ncbi:MAG: phosphatidate cytidylyltransferase [Bdellovibrionales bacterium]|jgi:phosphatidate cytidylyltransferase|nr:phosphatidate cytidylyltransferase [Bdellovibrionales bacterium]